MHMHISRGNYIRQKLDDPALAEAFGSEWDTLHAEWQASLPADTEAVKGYLASLPEPWRREEYDSERHGTRDEVEAAAEAWMAERLAEASRQEEEARAVAEEAARAEVKRLEEEAAAAEALRTEEETARQATVQAKAKLRDDIEKASTVPSLKAIMVKALERLGAI